MSSVREHLKRTHTEMASHYAAMAKAHDGISKCYMDKAEAGDGSEIGELHAALASHCADCAEFHLNQAKEIEKSAAADLSKTVPDNVRGVIPTDAPLAVPRFGQPAMPGPVSTSGLSELALEKILGASDLARFD